MALLKADGTLSGLVKAAGVWRINWIVAPQAIARPNIVLLRVSGLRDTPMDGPSGLVETMVQVDCYGETLAAALAVSRAVETVLSGYSGTQGVTKFDGVFLISERHGYEDTGTPTRLYRVSLDFRIWHKEA